MDSYVEWGFDENPFQTTAIRADRYGSQLLVGRTEEKQILRGRLQRYPQITCVEGLNGVGKTSLINVIAYEAYQDFYTQKKGQLLIPCRKHFQLTATSNLEDFKHEVLLEAAQTLIDRSSELKNLSRYFDHSEKIDAWLNSPLMKSWEASIASTIGVGSGSTANDGAGFQKSGLEKVVTEWLQSVFPNPQTGGIVCIIDNLELIQESKKARELIEGLRDTLFNKPGLRWVLCGANGIIATTASSPRMDGFLAEPYKLSGLNQGLAGDILAARIQAFGRHHADQYLPITSGRFETLHLTLNRNLRHTLSETDKFCSHISENSFHPKTDAEKDVTFDAWFFHRTDGLYNDVKSRITPKAWSVFDRAIKELQGFFSPSEFEIFGFESQQALRPYVAQLEENGLVVSTRDDGDKRMKTVIISSKGWLVDYGRSIAAGDD